MSIYKCNPSLCKHCSLELICSLTILTNDTVTTVVTNNDTLAIDWYMYDTVLMESIPIEDYNHETITKRSDNYIISRLIMKDIKESCYYWCKLSVPDYKEMISISNMIHIQFDNNTTRSCSSSIYSQSNNTCADNNNTISNTIPNTDGISIIIISCVCSTMSCLVFLLLIAIYWTLYKQQLRGLLLCLYHL